MLKRCTGSLQDPMLCQNRIYSTSKRRSQVGLCGPVVKTSDFDRYCLSGDQITFSQPGFESQHGLSFCLFALPMSVRQIQAEWHRKTTQNGLLRDRDDFPSNFFPIPAENRPKCRNLGAHTVPGGPMWPYFRSSELTDAGWVAYQDPCVSSRKCASSIELESKCASTIVSTVHTDTQQ